MDLRRSVPLALALSALVPGCNPYHNRSGGFLAGSVDPVNFPAPYQGQGFTHNVAPGTFVPAAASYNGNTIAFFSFPVSGTMPITTLAPGQLLTATNDPNAMPGNQPPSFAAPVAYVFDPQAPATAGMPTASTSPYPAMQKCTPPANYVYDERTDAFRLDEQGSVFTALPDNTGMDPGLIGEGLIYSPIISEVIVQSNGEPCQDIKSSDQVVARNDVTLPGGLNPPSPGTDNPPSGKPDGNFISWAIIDPSADVLLPSALFGGNQHNPNTGLGPQKWGWFDHYLLAYIDGGYVPTVTMPVMDMKGNPVQTTQLVAQTLLVPTAIPDGMGGSMPNMAPGSGFDIMQFARGVDAGYSPICHILFFTPADPTNPPTSFQDVTAAMLQPDTNQFISCLQVQ